MCLQFDEMLYTSKKDDLRRGPFQRGQRLDPDLFLLRLEVSSRHRRRRERARIAEGVVNGELDKLAVDHVPYFMTDGYKPYRTVLLERYGMYVIGNRGRGRP